MTSWKTALGIGVACAACCAVPLAGGVAALTAGTATLAATGSALLTCAKELIPLAWALVVLGAMGAGYILRRRLQRANTAVPNGCGCESGACRQ